MFQKVEYKENCVSLDVTCRSLFGSTFVLKTFFACNLRRSISAISLRYQHLQHKLETATLFQFLFIAYMGYYFRVKINGKLKLPYCINSVLAMVKIFSYIFLSIKEPICSFRTIKSFLAFPNRKHLISGDPTNIVVTDGRKVRRYSHSSQKSGY